MNAQGHQQVTEHAQRPQDPENEVDAVPANGNSADTVDSHRHQEVWEYSQLSRKRPPSVHDKVVDYERWSLTGKINKIQSTLISRKRTPSGIEKSVR